MKFFILSLTILLTLSACADNSRDYDAEAKCSDEGHKPGTSDYDKCVSDEKAATLMEQQRDEFEQMKQQQQDILLEQQNAIPKR